MTNGRSSRLEVFCKNDVLKNFANSQESTCVGVSFLKKLQAFSLQLYWRRNSDAGVFLWILENFGILDFCEFHYTSGGCSWKLFIVTFIFVGAKDKLLTSETINTLNLLSLAKQNKHCSKSKKYVPKITLHKSYDFLEGPWQLEELIKAKKLNLCLSD